MRHAWIALMVFSAAVTGSAAQAQPRDRTVILVDGRGQLVLVPNRVGRERLDRASALLSDSLNRAGRDGQLREVIMRAQNDVGQVRELLGLTPPSRDVLEHGVVLLGDRRGGPDGVLSASLIVVQERWAYDAVDRAERTVAGAVDFARRGRRDVVDMLNRAREEVGNVRRELDRRDNRGEEHRDDEHNAPHFPRTSGPFAPPPPTGAPPAGQPTR